MTGDIASVGRRERRIGDLLLSAIKHDGALP